MIRIRKVDGSIIEVPRDGHFVELVNEKDGTIANVFYQPAPGVISTIHPGTTDAARYAGMFLDGLAKFAEKVIRI